MGLAYKFKSNCAGVALRSLGDRFEGALSVFVNQGPPASYGKQEASFVTADNREIPLLSSYRYSIKAGWRYFRVLDVLADLESRRLLNHAEASFLAHAKGSRTIAEPPELLVEAGRRVADRIPELFVPGWHSDPEGPVLNPTAPELRKLIVLYSERHARMLKVLEAANIFRLKRGASVLEAGFTTGGHSIFAFEQLGFKAYGVDNLYQGLVGDSSQWECNKRLLNSRADFRIGDITRTTSFPAESMDMVFSVSVLEHVQDLRAAFAEMYRILKPGGAIIHNYGPYFCVDGGHALGVGDAPWAHVRMSPQDFLRYVEEFRPYEAAAARGWFENALHNDMPQWRVQRLVAESGFRVAAWLAKPVGKRWLRDLTPAVMRDCFAATPNIGIEDLVSRSVTFVGIKD